MDTRLTTTRSTWPRLLAAIVAVLIAVMQAAVAPTLAASAACRVTNLDTAMVEDALQAAVDAASAGQHLTVEGTCHGTTVIDKDLVITGIETGSSGRPTLDGDGEGTVVRVLRLLTVTIEDLTIEHGAASASRYGRIGGGIRTGRR